MFRYTFTTARKQRRWRISLALLTSGLLHLFALLAYERWAAENVERILHPVRFQAVKPALPIDPFKSAAPVLPLTQLERRMSEQPPAELLTDVEIIDQITPLTEKPDSILAWRAPRFMGEKSAEFEAVRDTFVSLEDLSLEMERRRAEEKADYARLWMPDADTTDADSRSRKKAAEIVDRAIEAMGGMDRLLQVRDMHTEIEIYNPSDFLWIPAGERLFYQGRKFMENLPGGQTRGYDGERAWAYRYGISRPTHTDLLKQQAERWDFISRFKGEGIALHYLGKITLAGGESARAILGESAHIIQVDDRKYGVLREAYFSPTSHLLLAEKQHGVLTKVQEYRTVDGIKTPYEVQRYFRRFTARYRFNTRFNTGLESSFFDDPGERTWDSNSMVALLGFQADPTMQVALNEITQIYTIWRDGKPVDVILRDESRHLLDVYLGKKLKSAGVLGDASSRYNVDVTIKGYYREAIDLRDPTYTINFHLVVADKESTKPLLDHIVSHKWKSMLYPPIDQSIAERLTSMLVESIGHALASKNRG